MITIKNYSKRHFQSLFFITNFSQIEYNDEVTSNQSDFSEHSEKEEITNQQNQVQDKNSCTICFKSFPNPNYVKEHIEYIHEEIKRFYCDLCSCAFYYDHHLRRHYKSKHDTEMSSDMSKYTKGKELSSDVTKCAANLPKNKGIYFKFALIRQLDNLFQIFALYAA